MKDWITRTKTLRYRRQDRGDHIGGAPAPGQWRPYSAIKRHGQDDQRDHAVTMGGGERWYGVRTESRWRWSGRSEQQKDLAVRLTGVSPSEHGGQQDQAAQDGDQGDGDMAKGQGIRGKWVMAVS